MSKANFMPLSELDPARFNFPVASFIDQERILVNPERLQRLGRLGAFSEVTVTSYSGEQSSINVGVAGHGNGVAFGSASATANKVETGDGSYNQNRPWEPIPLTIRLNSSEITQQVESKARKHNQPIRDPQPWARELDKAVRKEALAASWKHLMTHEAAGISVGGRLGDVIYTTATIGLTALEAGIIYNFYDIPKLMGAVAGFCLLLNIPALGNTLRGADWRSQAFSFFPTPIDRALAATVYGARPGSIVKSV